MFFFSWRYGISRPLIRLMRPTSLVYLKWTAWMSWKWVMTSTWYPWSSHKTLRSRASGMHRWVQSLNFALEGAQQFFLWCLVRHVRGHFLQGNFKFVLEVCKGHYSKSTGHQGNRCGCRGLFWGLWIGHTIGGLTVYSDEVASYDIVLHAGITYWSAPVSGQWWMILQA